jgi:hypothetical protein
MEEVMKPGKYNGSQRHAIKKALEEMMSEKEKKEYYLDIIDEFERLQAEVERLKGFVAGLIGTALYRDDGELQDNSEYPFIDFKRDSTDEIIRKFAERSRNAVLNRHQSEEE